MSLQICRLMSPNDEWALILFYLDLMLLKFLPSERCRIDRFFANHTSSVDRSESRPVSRRKEKETDVKKKNNLNLS